MYGEVVAVEHADLEVRAGGSLAIVGESGSGKTTIAKMIVGLTRPTAGEIRAQTGISYVLISHDLAVVRQLTDEVMVMYQGKVVERGATDAVLDEPQEAYTRVLRESVPRPGWKPSRRLQLNEGAVSDGR